MSSSRHNWPPSTSLVRELADSCREDALNSDRQVKTRITILSMDPHLSGEQIKEMASAELPRRKPGEEYIK